MLFMRKDGGDVSLCFWRGGVGKVVGRLTEALFRRAAEGLGEGGCEEGSHGKYGGKGVEGEEG